MFFLVSYQTFKSIKIHPQRITKADRNMVNDLHYDGIKFPVSGKDFGEIEKGNNISINAFCYEKNWFVLFMYQTKYLKTVSIYCLQQMKISHIMSTSKTLADLCVIRQDVKLKSTSANVVYNVFVAKKF